MYLTSKSMNNPLSHFGLVDPKISTSDKDLPVQQNFLELELELKLEQMQILQGLPGTCYQI